MDDPARGPGGDEGFYAGHPSRPPRKAAQDRLDVEGIFQAQRGKLDTDLLRREARDLGVAGELASWP